MTSLEIRAIVLKALTDIAPEIDPKSIDARRGFRDQFDLDSVDFLNFVLGIHKALGIDIPERDYPKLGTLDAAVAYLQGRQSVS